MRPVKSWYNNGDTELSHNIFPFKQVQDTLRRDAVKLLSIFLYILNNLIRYCFRRMISAPCFHDDRVPLYLTNDAILERFVEIIDKRKNFVPVSCTWRYYPQYVVAKLKDACVILLHPSKFVD